MQTSPATEAASMAPKKTSGLAVTAFVLSLIIFLPLLPLIGAVLGIIALATMRPDRGGKGLAIAAIPTGLVVTFFLQGIMAAVAIPSFIKYTRKAKTIEATESLDKLSAGARAYLQAERYDQQGQLLPHALPAARTDWVPRTPCCEQASRPKCQSGPEDWNAEPWLSLHFMQEGPHYYQYRYLSDGKTATIEARGDLDCDGTFSSYQYQLAVGEDASLTARGPIISDEIE